VLKTTLKVGERVWIAEVNSITLSSSTKNRIKLKIEGEQKTFNCVITVEDVLEFAGLEITCVRASDTAATIGFHGPREIPVIREGAKCKQPK
jgi:sRNA-binding carbon storage regulator CsrA